MKAFFDWLDDRTGYRDLVHESLYERIPGGSRWRYVWGSTLVFAFGVQLITGLFLWMAYSPSGQTAWESVAFIQYEMTGGWLLRGLHHFMAQAMIVLLALHLLQVVIDGAYRAPREVNFWLGLILMQIVLGLSLTGYLLPWDQKGYWATRVATNLMGLVPVYGGHLQQLVVGGSDYGHYTLTRFFALHAGLLPALLILFLVGHVAIFRRHGVHARNPNRAPEVHFWPDQVLKDAVACLAVLAVVVFFIFRPALFGEPVGDRPGDVLGAELGAPADPSNQYSAARPEWYFLFLFQFLKYFEGSNEIIGALVIPSIVMILLFLMPIVGRWDLGHRFNIGLICALLIGVAILTGQAWYDDYNMGKFPVQIASSDERKREESAAYLRAVEEAEEQAARALALVRSPEGIGPGGAIALMRSDAKLQGPRLFSHCAMCHDAFDSKGQGIHADKSSAPDLYQFASRQWIAGLLDPKQVAGPRYFGPTKHKAGDMVDFVNDTMASMDPKETQAIVAALSAEAALPSQAAEDVRDAKLIASGRKLIESTCTDCHKFRDTGELGNAPDLTGYGSPAWLADFIAHPAAQRFYGEHNDRMPSFAVNADKAKNRLSPQDLDLLVRWLRGTWYEPLPVADSAVPAQVNIR